MSGQRRFLPLPKWKPPRTWSGDGRCRPGRAQTWQDGKSSLRPDEKTEPFFPTTAFWTVKSPDPQYKSKTLGLGRSGTVFVFSKPSTSESRRGLAQSTRHRRQRLPVDQHRDRDVGRHWSVVHPSHGVRADPPSSRNARAPHGRRGCGSPQGPHFDLPGLLRFDRFARGRGQHRRDRHRGRDGRPGRRLLDVGDRDDRFGHGLR